MADALIPRVGVGVIIMRNERVLLGLRLGSHGAGTWALPGGHLESGETIEACARREVLEETGLRLGVVTLGPYCNDVLEAEGKHYLTLIALGIAGPGEPQIMEPTKCGGWQWFAWSKLPTPLFQPLASLVNSGYVPAW